MKKVVFSLFIMAMIFAGCEKSATHINDITPDTIEKDIVKEKQGDYYITDSLISKALKANNTDNTYPINPRQSTIDKQYQYGPLKPYLEFEAARYLPNYNWNNLEKTVLQFDSINTTLK